MKTLSGIYEGYNYSIDEFANIKDLETGLDVPCYIDSKTKFHIVRLHKNKKYKTFNLHRIVYNMYHEMNFKGRVCFLDGNYNNLHHSNLSAKKIKSLIGNKYGRLIVLSLDKIKNGQPYWMCLCECGNKKSIRQSNLTSKVTTSCGCYKKEMSSKRAMIHGETNTKLFKVWNGIRGRCYTKTAGNYSLYGGRGIKMTEEWKNKNNGFLNFKKWANEFGYNDNLTLDRIDVNGDYEPSNCRWVTMTQQNRNKRNSNMIEYLGEVKHLYEWCEKFNLNKNTVVSRYSRGLRGEDLFKPIVDKYYKGENNAKNIISK